MGLKRDRSHAQAHDKNNTTNDHTKNHPPHLETIEGGAATERTTSHTRVGGRAEVSVGDRVGVMKYGRGTVHERSLDRKQGRRRVGLYTILLLPILYVEWQHGGGAGGSIYSSILIAKYNRRGVAIKELLNAKKSVD